MDSRDISLFTDYHKEEDRITNYFGLLLKMLYEESPVLYHEVIASFLGDLTKAIPPLTPAFEQQVKTEFSRPDMCVTQPGYSLWFENKTTDWFHKGQLINHLKGLKSAPGKDECKVLLLLCGEKVSEKKLQEYSENEQEIQIAQLVYGDIISTIQEALKKQNYSLGNTFNSFLDEFSAYLDRYAPSSDWETVIDIVNTTGSFEQVKQYKVYECPDSGGAYSHRRCRYFGTYRNKETGYVAEILGIVNTNPEADPKNPELKIQYKNKGDEAELIRRAQEYLEKSGDDGWRETHRVKLFILSDLVELNVPFKKDSSGGMFSPKVYFYLPPENTNSIDDLANYLSGKKME